MPRAFLYCVAMAILSAAGRAGEATSNSELLIRLEVGPAPEPRPALRYQLLPELAEQCPGNPVQGYLNCAMEQQAFLFDKASSDRREELLALPLEELRVRGELDYGKSVLIQADRAARLDNPDWQILLRMKAEGFYTLLPDVQQIRSLARALAVRLRAEIALDRYDDAVRTLKTMFAISRHLGEHPTVIGNLVGIAIGNIAIPPLEEMLQRPGCPNLYWALTYLPHPLVPMAKGIDGERVMAVFVFSDLDDRGPIDPAKLEHFINEIDKLLRDEEAVKSAGGVRKWLDAQTKDRANVDAARRRLVESGLPEDRVARFAPAQAILLDLKREYEVRCDESFKLVGLPIWQAEALAARSKTDGPRSLIADLLVPATKAVRRAEGRLEQRLAMLRHVEALRLHAAGHGGSLPGSLSEIELPLPEDPFTGKPFRYERKGDTAHLRGSPPPGEEKMPFFNVHYEITIRK